MTSGRAEFLRAMRAVANSVAVVTTNGVAGRHGATVSAFCSASADPPTVLVCLHASSRIASRVRKNRVFCVNVLDDRAASVADRFAGRGLFQDAERFDGVDLLADGGDLPVLSAAVAVFRCRMLDAHVAGSHLIVVGEVLAVHASGERLPLAYIDGQYATVSRHLSPNHP